MKYLISNVPALQRPALGSLRNRWAIALALSMALLPTVVSASELKLTYISNEGFLIEAGGRKVLVDALVDSNPRYISMSPEVRSKLEAAKAPFDDVDLVLATHYHGDHFEPGAVGRFLQANPRATFVSTTQALTKLRRDFPSFETIQKRVLAPTPDEGKRQTYPKLGLEVLNLHHGRNRRPLVENHGFVIDMGGWKILHVGDTEARRHEFAINDLVEDRIDIALLPGWIVFDSTWKGVVSEAIKPQRVVVMHLSPDWGDEDYAGAAKEAAKMSPEIRFFPHSMESHIFTKEPRKGPEKR